MTRALLPLLLLAACAAPAPAPTAVQLPAVAETFDAGEVELAGRPVALVFWQSW